MPWLLGDNDLSPLRHRTGLSNLVLCGMGDLPLLDVEPLRDLTALTNLQLQGWHSIPPLDTIPIPEGLTGLGLGKLAEDVDLGPLFERADWYALVLEGAGAPRGIGDLARLTALERLDFGGFDLSKWLPAQGTWPPALTAMELYRCQLPQDLGPIGTPNTLRNLNLSNCLTTDGQPLALHTLARTPDQPRLTVQVDRTVPLPTTPIPGVRVRHR
jgi:Leucine-rich repeat (LRR) protein